jgi:hypothetical protein
MWLKCIWKEPSVFFLLEAVSRRYPGGTDENRADSGSQFLGHDFVPNLKNKKSRGAVYLTAVLDTVFRL